VTLPRLLVIVPTGSEPRVASGPEVLVMREEQVTKCHSTADVRAAAGRRFVTISPVAPTPSKPGYGPPLGVEGVRDAVDAAGPTSVFALGGVTPANAGLFLAAGAHGVAIMGPVWRADDPAAVVAEYLAVLP
jgi:thiamine-phosphate pyrophosphorylase